MKAEWWEQREYEEPSSPHRRYIRPGAAPAKDEIPDQRFLCRIPQDEEPATALAKATAPVWLQEREESNQHQEEPAKTDEQEQAK